MVRGEDRWRAEYDRIVGRFRKIKANADNASSDVDAARDAAIEELHNLGYTRGEASEVLSRPIRSVSTTG